MKKCTLVISLIVMFGSPLFAVSGAFALPSTKLLAASTCSGGFSQSKCSACSGLSELGSGQDCSSGGSNVNKLIRTAVNILSFIVGITAVIMIIVSAVKFIASGGDSNSVSSAKSGLMWAVVGLVLVAIAQAIVHWTLNTSTNITSTVTPATSSAISIK